MSQFIQLDLYECKYQGHADTDRCKKVDLGNACDPTTKECGSTNVNLEAIVLWNRLRNWLPPMKPVPEWNIDLPSDVYNLQNSWKLSSSDKELMKAVGIKLSKLHGVHSGSKEIAMSQRTIRQIPPEVIIVAHMEFKDREFKRCFEKILSPEFPEIFKEFSPCLAIFGVSIYSDGTMCPYQQLDHIEIVRKACFELQSKGVPAIPAISWSDNRPTDMQEWADMLNLMGPNLRYVALNLQTISSRELDAISNGMKKLQQLVEWELIWIVFIGPKKAKKLKDLYPDILMVEVSRKIGLCLNR